MAIFASGTGSNALFLLSKSKEFTDYCELSTLICDRQNAPVLEKLKDYPVNCFVLPPKGLSRRQHEEKIFSLLEKRKIEWIFLAGYQRLLSSFFIQKFYDRDLGLARIVNIHPSLLPQFPGMKAYERAFEANVNPHGVTVHFVDEGMDTGSIIAQKKFERLPSDTLEDFIERGKSVEHYLYGEVFTKIIKGHLP